MNIFYLQRVHETAKSVYFQEIYTFLGEILVKANILVTVHHSQKNIFFIIFDVFNMILKKYRSRKKKVGVHFQSIFPAGLDFFCTFFNFSKFGPIWPKKSFLAKNRFWSQKKANILVTVHQSKFFSLFLMSSI